MEPDQFDEMARKAVQSTEANATLEHKEANELWAQIGEQAASAHVWWWRAAAVVLFLLSSSLTWYVTGIRQNEQELQVKLQSAEAARIASLNLLKEVEAKNQNQQKASVAKIEQAEAPVMIPDTVVRYIVEEKLIYVDREVFISSAYDTDSLIAIILSQQNDLEQTEDIALADDSKQYLSNFNVVFEDEPKAQVSEPQKAASFKFNLSLLKRN